MGRWEATATVRPELRSRPGQRGCAAGAAGGLAQPKWVAAAPQAEANCWLRTCRAAWAGTRDRTSTSVLELRLDVGRAVVEIF